MSFPIYIVDYPAQLLVTKNRPALSKEKMDDLIEKMRAICKEYNIQFTFQKHNTDPIDYGNGSKTQ